jgi:hypothetical protein
MTLFDVIRYPITSPPRKEDFFSIPEEMIIKWVDDNRCSWHDVDSESRYDRDWIFNWMKRNYSNHSCMVEIDRDIDLLRKLIKEYDT